MMEVTNLTKIKIRIKLFENLYHAICKHPLELSVVLASPYRMRKLNKKYRGKDTTADVLSFLIEKGRGEIFLNARRKNIQFLFVHGCLHLLGFDHKTLKDAKIMERKEKNILCKSRKELSE